MIKRLSIALVSASVISATAIAATTNSLPQNQLHYFYTAEVTATMDHGKTCTIREAAKVFMTVHEEDDSTSVAVIDSIPTVWVANWYKDATNRYAPPTDCPRGAKLLLPTIPLQKALSHGNMLQNP